MNGYEFASFFLDHYGDEGVEKMLRCTRGAETDWLEFKASLSFDPELEKKEKDREYYRQNPTIGQNALYWNVAKALVSLHNTRGGVLVIGIDDRAARCGVVGVPDEPGDFDRYYREVIGQGLLRDDLTYSSGRSGGVRHILSRPLEVEVHRKSYRGRAVAALLVRPATQGDLLSATETRNGEESSVFFHRQLGCVGQVIRTSPDRTFERGLWNQDLDGMHAAFLEGREAYFGPDPLPPGCRFLRLKVDGRDGNVALCFEEGARDTDGMVFRVDLARCNLSEGVRDAIRTGDVLSIAHPRTDPATGDLTGRFLVWNPDVTLSPERLGMASTFALPGVKYWLNLFSPDIPVERVNQGAFANQSLADCIANPDATCKNSEKGTFRENPCSIALGYPNDYDRRTVFANMERFVRHSVSQNAGRDVPSASWRTEVPLVAPDLGLSAKADAVSISNPDRQTAAVSLEVKSGKWDRFRGDRPKPEHVFQPSVYGAVLAERNDGRERVHSILFYPSPDGGNQCNPPASFGFCRSLDGDLYSEVVANCMNVRNEVLLFERQMEEGSAVERLRGLTVAAFRHNRYHANENRWNTFRPDVEKALAPFRIDDPLALEWCRQFLSFAATEDRLAREGSPDDDGERACQSDAWRLPLETRIKRGMALALQFPPKSQEPDARGLVETIEAVLADRRKPGEDTIACSIRTGDSVYLYPDLGKSTSIATTLPFAAVVEKFGTDRVTLRLEEPVPESAAGFGMERRWIMEGRNDRGQDLLFSGAVALLAGVPRRQDILLGRIDPEYEPNAVVPPVETDSDRVREILENVWREKDYYLIWGPPGTGKTHSMIRALVKAALADDADGKILLLSYTNRAADELCDMLESLKAKRLPDLDWWRIGNPGKCPPNHRSHLPSARDYASRDAVKDEFASIRIFVGTISSLGPDNAVFKLGENAAFKLAVVDEASQLLEPQAAPLFCARKKHTQPDPRRPGRTVEIETDDPLIEKFVFVGDDRQLPAVVQQSREESKVDETSALRGDSIQLTDRRDSLFERLHRLFVDRKTKSRCGLLYEQHRMPPVLCDFVSREFYNGKLKGDSETKKKKGDLPVADECVDFERFVLRNRLGFVSVRDTSDGGDAKSNGAEADRCGRIVAALLEWKRVEDPSQIGIVVPFRKQIDRIREAMRHWQVPDEFAAGVLVDTVERFQGSQCDVVLYSTVIGSPHAISMISDEKEFKYTADGTAWSLCKVDRKLNVAITRAKEQFFLLGNEEALSASQSYQAFVNHIKTNGAVYEA